MFRFYWFTLILLLFAVTLGRAPDIVHAQDTSSSRSVKRDMTSKQLRIFKARARAIDARTLSTKQMQLILWGIDESQSLSLEFAQRARVILDTEIGEAPIECHYKSRIGEDIVAQCFSDSGQDLAILMIQSGYAVVDRAQVYGSSVENIYISAEINAQMSKEGIWASETGMGVAQGDGMFFTVVGLVLFTVVLIIFGIVTILIMRGFRRVIDAQHQFVDILGREKQLQQKELIIVANMLDAEIRSNQSKIEAYLIVYEDMLNEVRNPQRQPKYKKTGDVLQKYPSLDRSVYDRNTDKMDVLGTTLAGEVIQFYAHVYSRAEYVNIDPEMPLEDAMRLIEECIVNAKNMSEQAEKLIQTFEDKRLSSVVSK